MNCKPNDLAVVVRTSIPGVKNAIPPELLGRVVKVARVVSYKGYLMWVLAETVTFTVPRPMLSADGYPMFPGQIYQAEVLPDAVLQPLNPGDTPDETLAWKPVPATPEAAPATPGTLEVTWSRLTLQRRREGVA